MIQTVVREKSESKDEEKYDGNHGNLTPDNKGAKMRITTDISKITFI